MALIDKVKGAPVDQTAAKVVGRGVHWEPELNEYRIHQEERPRMREVPTHPMDQFVDYTGVRHGRMAVIGLFDDNHTSTGHHVKRQKKPALWVVQCDCGLYEVRRGKALKRGGDEDRCWKCWRLARARRRNAWLAGEPVREAKDY